MAKLPELVIHIGAGKTGSTSIQFALRRSSQILADQHAAYLGLILEQVPGALAYEWCQEGTPVKFFRTLPKDRARVAAEMKSVLTVELHRLAALGVTRVIWSNEAFLSRSDRMLDIVRALVAEGVPIRLICYVRRHDKWARSAYVQFGLKGKTYVGPLRDFREWAKEWTQGFAADIQTWSDAFPGKLELYNFDAVGDVVAHFCTLAQITGIDSLRANETPSNALLAAWAVFNGAHPKPVLPEAFTRLAAPLQILGPKAAGVPPLDKLLPTADDLVAMQDVYREDFDKINDVLIRQGQPPLVFDRPDEKRRDVAPWEIDRMLFQMAFSLQRQVLELQEELRQIKEGGPKA